MLNQPKKASLSFQSIVTLRLIRNYSMAALLSCCCLCFFIFHALGFFSSVYFMWLYFNLLMQKGLTWIHDAWQCKNDEEIVAVLAHELGHWKLNHTMYTFIAMQVGWNCFPINFILNMSKINMQRSLFIFEFECPI